RLRHFNSLLSYAYRVAYSGDYNRVAGLAPFHDEVLNPLDNLVSRLKYLFLHRSNRLQNTLLDNHSVDRYLLFRSFLLDLETFRPNSANRGPNALANLACGLALEL